MNLLSLERDAGHPGLYVLRRLRLGEIEAPEADALQAHLASCPACAARARGLVEEAEVFRFQHPFPTLPVPTPVRGWWRGWFLAPMALVGAAVVAFVLVPPNPPAGPGVRTKAGVSLGFDVAAGDAAVPGTPGGVYRQGDRIQLRYTTGEAAWLVVVSLDARGQVTAFYDDAGAARRIEAAAARPLDESVVLDDARGPERVIGCFARERLSTEVVTEAARRALDAAGGDPRRVERLDLPCEQAGFWIQKE